MHAITALELESEDPELEAAKALMRKRRLGPYGKGDRFEKDLGAMARAGFSLRLARDLLKLETVEEVEDYQT